MIFKVLRDNIYSENHSFLERILYISIQCWSSRQNQLKWNSNCVWLVNFYNLFWFVKYPVKSRNEINVSLWQLLISAFIFPYTKSLRIINTDEIVQTIKEKINHCSPNIHVFFETETIIIKIKMVLIIIWTDTNYRPAWKKIPASIFMTFISLLINVLMFHFVGIFRNFILNTLSTLIAS